MINRAANVRTKNITAKIERGCDYNSRLLKGGALLEDMRLLVRNWKKEGGKGQIDDMVAENLLGKHTRWIPFEVRSYPDS